MADRTWRLDLANMAARELLGGVVDRRFRFHSFVEEFRTGDFVGHLDYRREGGETSTTEVRLELKRVLVSNRERLIDLVLEELRASNEELLEFCGLSEKG